MRLYVVGDGIYFLFDASLGIVFIEIFVPHLVECEQKFCEFVEARKKGISFKFEQENEDINIYDYDFIFMHLIANFEPEAFANSLEYRDTAIVYDLYVSKIRTYILTKFTWRIYNYAKTTFSDQYTRS